MGHSANAAGPRLADIHLAKQSQPAPLIFDISRTWPDKTPSSQQLFSIRIVADVLGVKIGEDAADHPFGRNVCPEILRKISNGDFDMLSTEIFEFMKGLLESVAM